MVRGFLLAGAVVIGALGHGAADVRPVPARRPGGPADTVAVFNMAAVMRDFGKAKYHVHLLSKKRDVMSAELIRWRAEYTKLQDDSTFSKDPTAKEAIRQEMTDLHRKIEDESRKVDKALNDEASATITQLYTDIKGVVDATAAAGGYRLILAYPDAVSDEEKRNPYIHELKLKPSAALPFYVHPEADVTAEVTRRLNAEHPPLDDKGQKVDVSRLPAAAPPARPATKRD